MRALQLIGTTVIVGLACGSLVWIGAGIHARVRAENEIFMETAFNRQFMYLGVWDGGWRHVWERATRCVLRYRVGLITAEMEPVPLKPRRGGHHRHQRQLRDLRPNCQGGGVWHLSRERDGEYSLVVRSREFWERVRIDGCLYDVLDGWLVDIRLPLLNRKDGLPACGDDVEDADNPMPAPAQRLEWLRDSIKTLRPHGQPTQ